jgi:hypothetical protein
MATGWTPARERWTALAGIIAVGGVMVVVANHLEAPPAPVTVPATAAASSSAAPDAAPVRRAAPPDPAEVHKLNDRRFPAPARDLRGRCRRRPDIKDFVSSAQKSAKAGRTAHEIAAAWTVPAKRKGCAPTPSRLKAAVQAVVTEMRTGQAPKS